MKQHIQLIKFVSAGFALVKRLPKQCPLVVCWNKKNNNEKRE